MRIQNTLKNSMAGFAKQAILMVINLVSRKIFIDTLGVEYLGLNGLFTNILAMLALAELGVGSAITYSLYKPLHDGNQGEISGLMKLYRRFYSGIAMVILVLGILLSFFIQYFISDVEFELGYVRLIFLLFLANTVMSYLFAYKRSLLYADQRNYVVVKLDMITSVVGAIAKIGVLIFTGNYIIYLLAQIIFTVLPNIVVSRQIDKEYPFLSKMNTDLPKDQVKKILGDIRNIFVHKVSSFVVSSTDNIIIASFVGIRTVGIFSNYTLIISTVSGFLNQILEGVQASLGNLAFSEERENLYDIFKKYNFLCFIITSFCSVSFIVLLEDFIALWIGPEYLLEFIAVLFAVINLAIGVMLRPIWQVMTISGLFKEDKFNAIVEMVVNLVLSIILVTQVGLVGVLIGTTVSYLIAGAMKTYLLFKKFFRQSAREYLMTLSMYLLLIAAQMWLCIMLGRMINIQNGFLEFVVKMFVCLIVPNGINILLFHRTYEFKYFKDLSLRLLGGMRRGKKNQD